MWRGGVVSRVTEGLLIAVGRRVTAHALPASLSPRRLELLPYWTRTSSERVYHSATGTVPPVLSLGWKDAARIELAFQRLQRCVMPLYQASFGGKELEKADSLPPLG